MTQFCLHCLMKRVKEEFGGKELLYPNEPPPWIKAPDEAEVEKPAEKEPPKTEKPRKAERHKKQNLRMVIPQEEIDDHLYKRSFELRDGLLTFEIMKMKNMNKSAAHAFMIQLRQRAKAEKEGPSKKKDDQASKVNPRRLLPWCPNVESLFPRGLVSGLDQKEQIRFLAICQNAMNSGSFRFAHNVKDLKEFQKRADPERSYMESLIVDNIESNLENDGSIHSSHPLSCVPSMAYGFVLKRWRKRWNDKSFPQKFDTSAPVCSIEWKAQVVPSGQEHFPELIATILKGRHDRIQ
ncbi:hypothetical protein COOONC_20718, partial [Cooperia oncophora]